MKECAIVILNWNGEKLLNKFLKSVIDNSLDTDIIVIDNASTDNSVIFLKENYPNIKVIENTNNGGFAKGYNDGLAPIKGNYKYYALLNSDIEVTPNWLEPIIELLNSDDKIAACQPKIKDYNNKDYFEYAGASGGYLDRYGYPFCRGRVFNHLEKDEGQYDDIKKVFWASGACLFIRAEIFHELGGFDEDFFAHMEEIDLCWRINNRGYDVYVCPNSTVYHVGGGTLNKANPFKTYLNFRNSLYIVIKNANSYDLAVIVSSRAILDFVAAFKFLFFDKPSNFIAIIKAHFSVYKNLKLFVRKRKQEKNKYNITCIDGVYSRSIVFNFYIKQNKKFNDLGISK